MDRPAFAFLVDLHARLDGRRYAPHEVLDAVAYLTSAADPDRAERLRPRAGEPAPLVERLAVWALHRVEDDVVVTAHALLAGELEHAVAPVAPPVRELVPC